jgi:hypothetical protein
VVAGAAIQGATYLDGDAGTRVNLLAVRDTAGGLISAFTDTDGGVQRFETACGASSWWGGAAEPNTTRRFFLGSVGPPSCNLGNGAPVTAAAGQVQWLLARYVAQGGPGVPVVRTFPLASHTLKGPGAMGVSSDGVWVAYPAVNGQLRLEKFSTDTLVQRAQAQAGGRSFAAGQNMVPALGVADVVPHPIRDRVYVLATVTDLLGTFGDELWPAVTTPTVVVLVFDRAAVLLSAWVLPDSSFGRSASAMGLVDEQLLVSGQCTGTPDAGGGNNLDPLCLPQATNTTSSFLFAMPAP